uniref:Uncharacterized protein MANES_05G203200 n=1 Tax=Rhizophora mucronata TaxID=61149 RepID=A0A2P2N4H2_RHIMU
MWQSRIYAASFGCVRLYLERLLQRYSNFVCGRVVLGL